MENNLEQIITYLSSIKTLKQIRISKQELNLISK